MLLLYPQRYRSEQLSLVAALRSVQGHFIDHNALRFAPCKVETNARLNVGSTAMPLCRVGEGSTMRAVATTINQSIHQSISHYSLSSLRR